MQIQKRRVVKWSLDQVEAIPGITTQGIIEECVKFMLQNDCWSYTEMADWFNKQKDAQGNPKFLNAVGAPFSGPNIAHLASILRAKKRKRKSKPNKSKLDYGPYAAVTKEQYDLGRTHKQIHDFLVANHQFPGDYNNVRNYVTRNLRPKSQGEATEVTTTPVATAAPEAKPRTVIRRSERVLSPLPQASSCEPYRSLIIDLMLLQKPPVEIIATLRLQGYDGGDSSVRRFIRAIRKEAHKKVAALTPNHQVIYGKDESISCSSSEK
jgi:hypothetical protein